MITRYPRTRQQKQPCLLLLLLLFALSLPNALIAEIPSILFVDSDKMDTTYPIWVSHSVAIGPDGKVRTELFHPQNAELLQESLTDPPQIHDGCITFDEFYTSHVDPPDRSSFQKLLSESDVVFIGTIVDSDFGFDRGEPGQLFEVAPEEVFLGELSLPSYYFFFPVGNFTAGSFKICKTDRRYPSHIPIKGDQVLLAVPRYYKPVAGEPYLNLVYETSIVVIKPDGELSLPAIFLRPRPENDPQPFPVDRADLLRLLRSGGGNLP